MAIGTFTPTPLAPNDPRVEHRFFEADKDITYHYIFAKPHGPHVGTVLLLHGWPDLGMGWRYQVPYLTHLGMRVIVPDMLGYGKTSAPQAPEAYSLKNMSTHMAKLVRSVTSELVILGGHDWGALFAWRLALYYPELFRAIFCFSIPYTPPSDTVVTLEEHVKKSPILQYQMQNASGEAENLATQSPEHLRGFLNSMYGGLTKEGLPGFDPWVGLVKERLADVGPTPLMDEEMMEFYVGEFSRTGLHGPMNWYRTKTINGEDELPLAKRENLRYPMPAMLVMAGQDPALTPDLANGQEDYFSAGLKKEVIPEASHWILVHCPEKANRCIGEFLRTFMNRI